MKRKILLSITQIKGGTAVTLPTPVSLDFTLPWGAAGRLYELWLQQGQTLVKAGFMPGGPSNTVVLQGDVAHAAAAGITLEPAGGSAVPSLPPVALINFA